MGRQVGEMSQAAVGICVLLGKRMIRACRSTHGASLNRYTNSPGPTSLSSELRMKPTFSSTRCDALFFRSTPPTTELTPLCLHQSTKPRNSSVARPWPHAAPRAFRDEIARSGKSRSGAAPGRSVGLSASSSPSIPSIPAAVRDGRLMSCAELRWHFRGKAEDSHAEERRGRGCFAGKVASIGRRPRGFSLP